MRILSIILFAAATAQAEYQHFEARQVHPLTMTPDGARLVAVDSPNASVTVFDLSSGMPVRSFHIPVGLEPVTARARTNDEVWVVNEVGDSVSIISLEQRGVMDTLQVGDEPTDVVFAAGKAFVSCARDNQIRVFDATTRAPMGAISLAGIYPHALLASADGARVYAAFLHSGNRTTVIKKQVAPEQGAPTNPTLPEPPDTARIVPANDARVTNIILDRDVAEIDAATHQVVRYISDLGTNLFDLAEHPSSGHIWVTNTEALNLIRFEPELRGRFVENRVSIITPGGVNILDLNPGVDYNVLPNPAAQAIALAQPKSLIFSEDGSQLWLAAFASDRIARLDPSTGAIVSRVDLRIGMDTDSSAMRGPRGLVLDEPRGLLYVLNKFSSTLTIIETATETIEDELPLRDFDPMPRSIREGRGYLFDARLSGNGTNSCGTCHIDADRDGLAWDLGDPGGEMLTVLGANLSVHDTRLRPRVMHPMKGPMVTQTLRGMKTGAPFHWRGDKPTLQSFNSTFDNLMGGSVIDEEDMDDLAAYLVSLVHHSNPNRNLDRTLPTSLPGLMGNPVTGRTLFNNHTKSHCSVCHVLPEGTDHNIDLPQESGLSQPVKNPPLRTTYQRMFYDGRPGSSSLSGFGMLHDGTGSSTTLPTVHDYVLDLLATPQEFADVTAFIRCFDTGTAKTVGFSRTVTAVNRADEALTASLTLLEARASADPKDCDLIVRGRVGGVDKAYIWTGSSYQADSQSAGVTTRSALLASLSAEDSLTFLGVLPGAGLRMSVDVDEDTVLNGDDPEPGVINGPPRITTHPRSLAVAPGAMASFTVVAEGEDVAYQWRRGSSNVGTNSPTLHIPAAALADAGSYTVIVSNAFGSRTSQPAVLNVVPPPVITKQPVSRVVNEGASVTFSISASGSNLSYQWRRGSTNIGGGDKATLSLAGVGALDIGSYSVVISNGDTSVTSDEVTLTVNLLPVIANLNLPVAIVGQDYSWSLSAAHGATRFIASGLPAGLKLNPSTGVIAGRPTAARAYKVKARAANAVGMGVSKEQEMNVLPFPTSAQGMYRGIIPRHEEPTFGNLLGGRIAITTTKLGAFSGSLVLGTTTHSFRNTLSVFPDTDPTGRVTITRRGLDPLTLDFTLVRATRSLAGTLSEGSRSISFTAALAEDAPASYAGNFTFAMKPPAALGGPRGHSVGAFKISDKGIVSGVIRLADGSPAVALSGPLGEGGQIPVFAVLYSRLGSLVGTLKIQQVTDDATPPRMSHQLNESELSWFKHPQARTRSYSEGFGPLILDVVGRTYLLHSTALALPPGPGNARLIFREGGVPDPEARLDWASFEIQPGAAAKILPPESNPGRVKLAVVPGSPLAPKSFAPGRTGSFSGSFILTDNDTSVTAGKRLNRQVTFYGMIVDDGSGQKGYGFFNLAEMPSAGPPPTTVRTSPILSGRVELNATAP